MSESPPPKQSPLSQAPSVLLGALRGIPREILSTLFEQVRVAGVAQGRAESRAEYLIESHDRAVAVEVEKIKQYYEPKIAVLRKQVEAMRKQLDAQRVPVTGAPPPPTDAEFLAAGPKVAKVGLEPEVAEAAYPPQASRSAHDPVQLYEDLSPVLTVSPAQIAEWGEADRIAIAQWLRQCATVSESEWVKPPPLLTRYALRSNIEPGAHPLANLRAAGADRSN